MWRPVLGLSLCALLLGALPCSAANEDDDGCCWSVPIRDPNHAFGQGVCSWKTLKQQNIVMQKRDFSCGAAALATIARYYWGDDVTEETFLGALFKMLTVEELRDRIENGLAISDLRRIAVKTGYLSTIGTLSWEKLTESKVPVVVPIKTGDYDHFVVYRGTDGARVFLADPIRGHLRVPVRKFLSEWQQNAILVLAKPGEELREDAPLNVADWEFSHGELNGQLIRTQHRHVHSSQYRLPR